MLIRIGYDIRFDLDVPAPVVAMLSVHPSRRQERRCAGVAAGAGRGDPA